MASGHTGFAPRTLIEVHFERELLPRFGRCQWNEIPIVTFLRVQTLPRLVSELRDRRHRLLFRKETLDPRT